MTTAATTAATAYSSNSVLNSYLTTQAQQQAATKAANSASASNSLSGNESTFLKILTSQLKNQDPTNATDPNQFTQELVMFTQAEQQINTNTSLSTLINLQKSSGGLATTLNYIGNYVEAPTTTQLPLQNGKAELGYTVPSGVSNVAITIQDANGKTVDTIQGSATAGLQYATWDGKNSSGTQLPDGAYTFKLVATDRGGNTVTVSDMRAIGLVTGVTSNSDGTANLSLGTGMTVKSSTVDAVYSSTNLPSDTSS